MRQAVVGYPRIERLALVVPEVKAEVWGAGAGALDVRVDVGAEEAVFKLALGRRAVGTLWRDASQMSICDRCILG